MPWTVTVLFPFCCVNGHVLTDEGLVVLAGGARVLAGTPRLSGSSPPS